MAQKRDLVSKKEDVLVALIIEIWFPKKIFGPPKRDAAPKIEIWSPKKGM